MLFDPAYYFWTMADALGHEYWYFTADSVPSGRRQPDTSIPIDKLEATLARALSERAIESA